MQRIICGSVCGLLWLGVVTFGVALPPKTDVADSGDVIKELAALSWSDLKVKFGSADEVGKGDPRVKNFSKEAVLLEIIRRGGSPAERLILDNIAKLEAQMVAAQAAFKDVPEGDNEALMEAIVEFTRLKEECRSLEVQTALNRIRRQPDPLAVVVDNSANLQATVRTPPMLKVALKNVDSEKRTLAIQAGGDYRSGRNARWRIHVQDADGKLLPHRDRISMILGGMYNIDSLEPGKEWKAELNLDSYVRIRKPGKYRVQVIYHDRVTIADSSVEDLSRLIVFRSAPFELNVEHGPKIPIQLTSGDMDKARGLVKSLNESDRVKILIGEYDESAHDFISPKSRAGKLLSMKWKAVPALLEYLEEKSLTYRKRAWILALLYSITLEQDLSPIEQGESGGSIVLPEYESRSSLGHTVIWDGGFSFSLGGTNRVSGGQEDVNAQKRLVDQWLQFRKEYLDIKIEK